MGSPRFSIIIPTLNEEKFLPNLLVSLTTQPEKPFEIIVVDGNSKDNTVDIAQSFSSTLNIHIKTIKKPSLPMQRNLGAQGAKGEWLIFVDADSVLMPYFLERVTYYIDKKNPQWFTTWCAPDSEVVHDAIFTLLANIYWESTLVIKRPVAPGPLTMIRRDVFDQVGGYDEEHAFNEDVEFGLRLTQHGISLEFLRETLYIWSMRRIRRESKIKLMNQYILSMIPILLLKRPFKFMPGYVMGGHLYSKNKRGGKIPTLKKLQKQLQDIVREMF